MARRRPAAPLRSQCHVLNGHEALGATTRRLAYAGVVPVWSRRGRLGGRGYERREP
jgi:hypothetical protein